MFLKKSIGLRPWKIWKLRISERAGLRTNDKKTRFMLRNNITRWKLSFKMKQLKQSNFCRRADPRIYVDAKLGFNVEWQTTTVLCVCFWPKVTLISCKLKAKINFSCVNEYLANSARYKLLWKGSPLRKLSACNKIAQA